MLDYLITESKKTEKIAMNMVNKAYPDTESLHSIKKGIEIIDKNKIIRKKKKLTLETPRLSIINGVLTYSGKVSDDKSHVISSENVKVEIHDKKRNQIRIHKFKVVLKNNKFMIKE
ncbi:MAG: hypothetical protein ACFFBP_15210 [Promethearchaeota archaeon]